MNNDLISRQAAIEAVRRLPNVGVHWLVSAEAVFDALLNLPSAQPFISDDGTVMISVSKGQLDKVGRVMVNEESTKYCKMMYEPERKKGSGWI